MGQIVVILLTKDVEKGRTGAVEEGQSTVNIYQSQIVMEKCVVGKFACSDLKVIF